MAKEIIYKCSFKHCSHASCEISQDEAVRIGNRYFHRDCAKTRNNIEEIKRLYYEKISNTVVMSQLLSSVNNIIFRKNVDSEYLLYALRYAIEHNIKLNSPYGLHYLIDDYKIRQAWTKRKVVKLVQEMEYGQPVKKEDSTFQVKLSTTKGFGDIFD